MLELIFGTKTKIKLLQALVETDKPMTRNELVKKTGSGIRSTYEQVEELIALGVIRETVDSRIRVALDTEFPLYESLRDLLLLSKEYLQTSKDVLAALDRICGDNYYIGSFTAARQKISPVDYDPPIYAVNILKDHYRHLNTRLMALGKLENINVYERKIGEPGDITIITSLCDSIPPDIIRSDILGEKVWIASVERGIIECLYRDTPFTMYGAYLALLQNRMDNALDINNLKKIAEDEGCLPLLLSVMSDFNKIADREIFYLTEKEKNMARARVDKKEIKHVINTVMG